MFGKDLRIFSTSLLMLPFRPHQDFNAASSEVLGYLQRRLGFGLWMVTRTQGNDWIVLGTKDDCYGVKSGDVFCWADSFCSRMVLGQGPRIAPCSSKIPAYSEAPIGQHVPIGAYIGVPLPRHNGSLFGTLCAIDPKPKPEEITDELPMIELLAQLLGTILEGELEVQEQLRRAERAQAESTTDSLTNVHNRRGWDNLVSLEEERCKRYGHSAAIIIIDLDGLKTTNDRMGHAHGDQLIQRAASVLRESTRRSDILARIGGDEFAVLASECDASGAEAIKCRYQEAMHEAGISASIGVATRDPRKSLESAWDLADRAMYVNKRDRKASELSLSS